MSNSDEAQSLADRMLLRPAEAAKILGISRSTLYQLLASGELGSCQVAQRARRVSRAQLVAFVERLEADNDSC